MAGPFFLQEFPARDDDIGFRTVHLCDENGDLLLQPRIHVVARTQVQLRTGQKGVDADIGDITALHFLRDGRLDRLPRLKRRKEPVPGRHLTGRAPGDAVIIIMPFDLPD